MTMRDATHLLRKLNPPCANVLEAAANLCHARLAGEITLEHWLLKLIEAGDGDISAILRRYEIDIDAVWHALLARFRTLVYRPLDAVALASIVRLKIAQVAERLRHQYGIALAPDGALTGSLAQMRLARESGARNVDAFPSQRILPAVSRELLSRMAQGYMAAEIRLSMSPEGSLAIDFVDRGALLPSADATPGHPVAAGI